MLDGIALLLLFQLFGEGIAYLLDLPIPGPVIGMVALYLAYPRLGRLEAEVQRVASGILQNLGLLFVPAGVGVMLHLGLVEQWWLALLMAIGASTVLGMAAAAGAYAWVQRLRGRP